MEVPLDHPFIVGFSIINHPFSSIPWFYIRPAKFAKDQAARTDPIARRARRPPEISAISQHGKLNYREKMRKIYTIQKEKKSGLLRNITYIMS